MKRLLLLLPLLLTPAAQAVDYVKCEAMNKAFVRASYAKKQLWGSSYRSAKKQVEEEKCGPEPESFSKEWFDCSTSTTREENQRVQDIAGSNPAYVAAKERIEKIKADYVAEGCY